MQKKKKVTACVLIIGNEILSGRTEDKNLVYLAKILNEHGVQITECRVIPDEKQVIVETINATRQLFDYVITTGGIGPTHDDITTDCVAEAFGVEAKLHPEIVELVSRRPADQASMKARLRMAMIPEGAHLVHADPAPPGYMIENTFVLAGIPSIMQMMAQSMVKMMQGGRTIHSKSIDAHLTESEIAQPLRDIQDRFADISIGSYPFMRNGIYGTSLVLRGAEPETLSLAFAEVEQLVASLNGIPEGS